MRLSQSFFLVLFLLFSSFSARAYENDTHRDMMYILCRTVGMNDEMSKYAALTNQWIDVSVVTSAMMLESQRHLFHFPGELKSFKSDAHGGFSGFKLFMGRLFSLTTRNSAFANYMIYYGLKTGDLQLVFAGAHIKMDSFGHEGFSSLFGHMTDGHEPDQANLETKKYMEMFRSLIQSLIAIRKALPEEYVDLEGAKKFLNENAMASHIARALNENDFNNSALIGNLLLKDKDLQAIFREDVTRMAEYKELALRTIYNNFKADRVINANISFEELFPKQILNDMSLEVPDIIRLTLMSGLNGGFLKTGQDHYIFDLARYLGFHENNKKFLGKKLSPEKIESVRKKYISDFYALMEVDKQAYKERMKELLHIKRQSEKLAQDYDNLVAQKAEESKIEMARQHKDAMIAYFNDEATSLFSDAVAAGLIDITDDENRDIIRDRQMVAKSGLHMTLLEIEKIKIENFMPLLEDAVYLDEVAQILAQSKRANEIAVSLTKDFIPLKKSDSIKDNFEWNTENRKMLTYYKGERRRDYIYKKFGVSWVMEASLSSIQKMKKASETIKKAAQRTPEIWETYAEKAMDRISPDRPDRSQAQVITYTLYSRFTWIYKMLFKFVAPSSLPLFGNSYRQKLIDTANFVAKDHIHEDMEKALTEGKYKRLVPTPGLTRQLEYLRVGGRCEGVF